MLTIMNLNCANYDDHNRAFKPTDPNPEPGLWADRLPLIVQAIVDACPDVIGLCEIRYDPNNPFNRLCAAFWQAQDVEVQNCGAMDMGQQIMTLLLARAPEYEGATMITDKGDDYGGGVWEGQSIISRFPVVAHGVIDHGKGGTDGNNRITQWAQLSTPAEGTLWVYNAHLSTDVNVAAQNAGQVLADMQARVGSFAEASACVVGDMNSEPSMAAMQAFAAAGLVDVWALLETGDGFTFQAWKPVKRIDYCWATPALSAAAHSITLIGTELQPPAGGSYLSDHIGVVTVFD